MTKKQKAAALAAGVALAAAVGTASLPGATQEPVGTATLPNSAQALADATGKLYAKSEDRGMTLPDDPGIRDVRDGMYDMAPTKGRDMELTISEEGPIETGDDLTLCHQFAKAGESVMLVDNATLLAVDTATYDGTTYAAIVFTRVVDGEPYTFLGAAELGETAPTLGGMVLLTAGAITDADVAIIPLTGLAVAVYAKDGAAWGRCAQIGAGASLESKNYFDWATGDPVNLNVAADELVCVAFSCVRTVDGEPVVTIVQGVQNYPDPVMAISEPIDLTPERFPALQNLTFDPAAAPEQWDLATTGDQTAENGYADDGTAYLSCPKADGKGHNVIILRTEGEYLHPVSHTERIFDGEVNGPTAVDAGTASKSTLAVVATTNHNDQTGKAWATLRIYALENAYDYPQGMDLTSTKMVTAQHITDVSVNHGDDGPGAISMVADGILYLTAYEVPQCDRGPTQAVAENVARGMAVASVDGTVWCVTQSQDGLLWLTPYRPEKVVRKAYQGDTVDGTAILGGEPGATCKASIWRPASDEYFAPIEGGEKTT